MKNSKAVTMGTKIFPAVVVLLLLGTVVCHSVTQVWDQREQEPTVRPYSTSGGDLKTIRKKRAPDMSANGEKFIFGSGFDFIFDFDRDGAGEKIGDGTEDETEGWNV